MSDLDIVGFVENMSDQERENRCVLLSHIAGKLEHHEFKFNDHQDGFAVYVRRFEDTNQLEAYAVVELEDRLPILDSRVKIWCRDPGGFFVEKFDKAAAVFADPPIRNHARLVTAPKLAVG